MKTKARLNRFINRIDELSKMKNKLHTIKSGTRNFDFIFTLSGIPGIGKTTLLEKIQETADEIGVKTIFVESQKVIQSAEDQEWAVLFTVADSLFATDDAWQKMVQEYYDHEGHPAQVYYHEQLQETFIENLRAWLANKPLVLILDDTHFISEPTQRLLEVTLERVHDLNRLFVLLAGRTDLSWRSFELRRRTQNIALQRFEEQETAQFFDEGANPNLSKAVYQITAGYPLASTQALKWIDAHFALSDPDLLDLLKAQEADLVFDLVSFIFNDYILSDLDEPATKTWLMWLLRNISPLRRFDDNLLHALLQELDTMRFQHLNLLDTRSYTRQMATLTYLVKWDSARIAYALDRPIRQLLSLEMQFRESERLRQIHSFAQKWYERAIEEVVAKDRSAPQSVIYLIEHLYHFVQYRQLQSETDGLLAAIKAKISHRFADYYLREKVHFFEEFKKDEVLALVLGSDYTSLMQFVEQLVDDKSADQVQQ